MKIIFLCTSPHETYYQIETLSHNKSDFGVYKKKQYEVNFFRVFNIKKCVEIFFLQYPFFPVLFLVPVRFRHMSTCSLAVGISRIFLW